MDKTAFFTFTSFLIWTTVHCHQVSSSTEDTRNIITGTAGYSGAELGAVRDPTVSHVNKSTFEIWNDKCNLSLVACNEDDESECVPKPVWGLSLQQITRTSIEVKWMEPPYPIERVSGYFVYVGQTRYTTYRRNFNLDGLSPGTKYTVRVTAFHEDSEDPPVCLEGASKAVTGRTLASVRTPSSVLRLTVVKVGSTSIHVTWWRPPESVSGYLVYVGQRGFITNGLEFLLEGLKPDTGHNVKVSCFNVDPLDPSVRVEGKPSTVFGRTLARVSLLGLVVGKVTSTSIEVTWTGPRQPVSGYFVYIGQRGYITERTKDSYLFDGLNPGTRYAIKVSPFNVDPQNPSIHVEGESRTVYRDTLAKAPPRPETLRYVGCTNTSIDFNFTRPLFSHSNGAIKEYVLLVAEGDVIPMISEEGNDTNVDFKSSDQVDSSREMYRASPEGWSPERESEICRTSNGVLTCTVGIQSCSLDRFCNTPLKKSTKYRFKIRAYTTGGWRDTNVIEATSDAGQVFTASFGVVAFLALAILLKCL